MTEADLIALANTKLKFSEFLVKNGFFGVTIAKMGFK